MLWCFNSDFHFLGRDFAIFTTGTVKNHLAYTGNFTTHWPYMLPWKYANNSQQVFVRNLEILLQNKGGEGCKGPFAKDHTFWSSLSSLFVMNIWSILNIRKKCDVIVPFLIPGQQFVFPSLQVPLVYRGHIPVNYILRQGSTFHKEKCAILT